MESGLFEEASLSDSVGVMSLGSFPGSSATVGASAAEIRSGLFSVRVTTPGKGSERYSMDQGEERHRTKGLRSENQLEDDDDGDDESSLSYNIPQETERRSKVSSLTIETKTSPVSNSKIDWGQEVNISPLKPTANTAAELAAMAREQKNAIKHEMEEIEDHLAHPRPLTGNQSHSRLQTPHVEFERMTDSPSPEKGPRPGTDFKGMTDDDIMAHFEPADKGREVFDIPAALDSSNEKEGTNNNVITDAAAAEVSSSQLAISDEDYVDEGAPEVNITMAEAVKEERFLTTQQQIQNQLTATDADVYIDVRPVVRHHGKTGRFTENIVQNFGVIGGSSLVKEGSIGSSSGALGSSPPNGASGGGRAGSYAYLDSGSYLGGLGSASIGSIGSIGQQQQQQQRHDGNIIKPLRGGAFTTSLDNNGERNVNMLLEKFVAREMEVRHRENNELTAAAAAGGSGGGNYAGSRSESPVAGMNVEATTVTVNKSNKEGKRDRLGGASSSGSLNSDGEGRNMMSIDGDSLGVHSKDMSHDVPGSMVGSIAGSVVSEEVSQRTGSMVLDVSMPPLPLEIHPLGTAGQLSDRSSLASQSVSQTDLNPLRHLTLVHPEAGTVNKLYDASQQEALAMFYLNDYGSKTSLNDDMSMSSNGGEINGLVPYRVHNRIMGWKLTSPQKRKALLGVLDGVTELNKPLTGSYASNRISHKPPAEITSRQAQAWGDSVRRMHHARDRTPQGYFKKLMKERAALEGNTQRGDSRPGSVQTRLISQTDKAGLHRAIRDGLVTMENEAFLDAVRTKSREQSRQRSRQASNNRNSREGNAADAGANANANANVERVSSAEAMSAGRRKANAAHREGLGSRGHVISDVTPW